MHKKMSNIAIIDLETSGLSQTSNAICQIAGKVLDKKFNIVATIDYYIKPYNKEYSKHAYDINNLSKEFLNEFGEHINIVMNDFIKFIFCNNVDTIVGHNVYFDKRFILEELKKISLEKAILFDKLKVIDTSRLNYNSRIKNRELKTICEYYNIEYSDKHNANLDVSSTESILKMLVNNKVIKL